jgi:hypothetical protein
MLGTASAASVMIRSCEQSVCDGINYLQLWRQTRPVVPITFVGTDFIPTQAPRIMHTMHNGTTVLRYRVYDSMAGLTIFLYVFSLSLTITCRPYNVLRPVCSMMQDS